MSRELLQQALDALKEFKSAQSMKVHWVIAALEQELAKPEQAEKKEPVTWGTLNKLAQTIVEEKYLFKRFIDGTPLANDIAVWMTEFALEYAAPPRKEWVGLTGEEILDLWVANHKDTGATDAFARAIEAKLKGKNSVS